MIDTQTIKSNTVLSELIGGFVDLKRSGNEFKGCCPFHDEKTPSFSVSDAKEFYYCYGCGASGDAIDFMQDYNNMSFKDACEYLGGKESVLTPSEITKRKSAKINYYDGYAPSPTSNQIESGQKLSVVNPKRDGSIWTMDVEASYPYINAGGEIYGYVVRTSIKGDKITPTVVWAKTPEGHERWVAMPLPYRMPYGMEQDALQNQIIVVEGEKCRDYGAAMNLPRVTFLSWCGGTNNIGKTDWSILSGRSVVYIRDNDEPGDKCALEFHLLAVKSGAKTIKHAAPESSMPKGWDIADGEFKNSGELVDWIKSHLVEDPEEPALSNVVDMSGDVVPVDYYDIPDDSVEQISYEEFISYQEGGQEITVTEDNRKILTAKNYDIGTIPVEGTEFPNVNSKSTPLNTIDNFEALCESMGLTLALNQMNSKTEAFYKNAPLALDPNYYEHQLHSIFVTACARANLTDKAIKDHKDAVSANKSYHPIRRWLGKTGEPNPELIDDVIDCLGLADKSHGNSIMKKWLVSAVACIYEEKFSSKICPVLNGKQSFMKTAAISRICDVLDGSFKEGFTLDPSNKDSVIQAVESWIVELGELDKTTGRSSAGDIKAFLSNSKDTYRAPYGKSNINKRRQTVFIASVNGSGFLTDETGSTRFQVLQLNQPCDMERINELLGYEWNGSTAKLKHPEKLKAFWSAVLALYQGGHDWVLSGDDSDKSNYYNNEISDECVASEMLDVCLMGSTPSNYYTFLEICEKIGIDATKNNPDAKRLKRVLKDRYGMPKQKAVNGVNQRRYWMPEVKTKAW